MSHTSHDSRINNLSITKNIIIADIYSQNSIILNWWEIFMELTENW